MNLETFQVDLKNLGLGIIAGILASFAFAAIGAQPALVTTISIASGILVTIAINRKKRLFQQSVAAVLRDPSSSESSRKALQFIKTLVESETEAKKIESTISLICDLRRYPHSLILPPLLLLRRADGSLNKELVLDRCEVSANEMVVSRRRVVLQLSGFIRRLNPASILVLYGYSTTICDALEAIGSSLENPVWVVEDLQYGGASVGEDTLVSLRLQRAGISFTRLTFDEFLNCSGSDEIRTLTTESGERVVTTRNTDLCALIGCDVSDDRGVFFIPGIERGRQSETSILIERFVEAQGGPQRRHLIIATETYKMVEDLQDQSVTTSAPLTPSLLVKLLHSLGLAIPYQGRPVRLVSVDGGKATVVTDRGVVAAPHHRDSLRELRERWVARLDSNLHGAVKKLETAENFETLEMENTLELISRVLQSAPPLLVPTEFTSDNISSLPLESVKELLQECFPESSWSPTEVQERVFPDNGFLRAFALGNESRVSGFVSLHTTNVPDTARLHWLAVTSAWRRKYHAMALVSASAKFAQEAGYKKVTLTTESDKVAAIRLYEKLGFDRV